MSLYGFMNREESQPKLFADRESGLNILVKEVQFEEFFNKIEKGVN